MARVTIVIPSFNHQNFIVERLDSIRFQEFKDWEAIIIDDASSDNSREVIESYLKEYPKFNVKSFIKNEQNSGSGYKSWKKGIELANSEYIWIAETDDYADLSFLQETVKALDNSPESAMVFTASNYVDINGRFIYDTSKRLKKLDLSEGKTKVFNNKVMLSELPLDPLITNGSSVLFRRPQSAIPSQLFSYRQLTDQFIWTYLVRNRSFVCINKYLNNFRRHEGSTTHHIAKKKQELLYQEYCSYHNYFKKSKPDALRIFKHYVRHFLIPRKSEVGYFYTKPMSELKEISEVEKIGIILRAYFSNFVSKIVNG